ncbi:patatin-like phospholipase family protein [Hyalangium gracile]|uniref:patatin-like phospholipase family protein n=1 Tax=Hyalangium gracile TaxID=394092 RepID=UPI001CCD2F90|nr:patatin-like phospholipase family protein [Hyalangium gracile]
MKRILALDGGGPVSLVTAVLMRRLEDARPGFISAADVISGTSAGGIMALILASKENPADGINACIELWSTVPVYSGGPLRTMCGVLGQSAFFVQDNLAKFLNAVIGDKTLKELERRVVVPTTLMDGEVRGVRTWRPKIFHNFPYPNEPDLEELAVDVALRTSASPVTFPLQGKFADGGLYANNPSLCALTQVFHASQNIAEENTKANEVRLLSIGAGVNPRYTDKPDADWGWTEWMLAPKQPARVIEVTFDAGVYAVDFQCAALLDGYYQRLNPLLTQEESRLFSEPMDAKHFVEVAERADLQPTLDWIDSTDWMNSPRTKVKRAAAAKAKVAPEAEHPVHELPLRPKS